MTDALSFHPVCYPYTYGALKFSTRPYTTWVSSKDEENHDDNA